MGRYMIESPHKPEECLRALDEELAKGTDVLEKVEFGCKAGDHTAYALIDAASGTDALERYVPSFLRNKARVIEVTRFTPEMIKSIHAKAA